MGRVVTIYLSDDEVKELKDFCDENQCTQYSALKTAVKQLLSGSVQTDKQVPQEIVEEPHEDVILGKEAEGSLEQIDENLISIERPETTGTPFFLSPSQERLLFWVGLLLMPTLVLVSGILAFRLRRKHR